MALRLVSDNSRKKGRRVSGDYFDYTLLFVVIFLIIFGLVMIYSTSAYQSAAANEGDSTGFLKKQLLATIIGIPVMMITIFVDYHWWEKFSFIGIGISFVLVFLVLTPMGLEINNARRWIKVGPLSLQPAEVVKIAIILWCSVLITHFMELHKKENIGRWKSMAYILSVPFVFAVLLWQVTSNLSSAIIVGGIAALMLYVADPDYKKYFFITIIVAVIAALIIAYAVKVTGDDGGASFRLKRISVWLDPESDASDKGFQTLQALYAIGSGGIFGKGLGGSLQKLGTLPEAQNDMIFSIICEELGLFGALAIILLFILLIWRCFIIANNARDLFGAMLVVGVMAHFAIQVVLNIAVVTNSVPNTGISLPFISYGGSSELFLMAEIGLVLNVSRQIGLQNNEDNTERVERVERRRRT
ncbi:MAG TPA: cell division protein [Lachnospiraceae bacterium]|nr:cell division protein [Lachnospiraceae bacterium]